MRKKLTFALLGLLICLMLPFSACEDEAFRVGCLSGIFPGTNFRVFIQCITSDQFAQGGNTFNGVSYNAVMWTPVSDCNECLTLDYENM